MKEVDTYTQYTNCELIAESGSAVNLSRRNALARVGALASVAALPAFAGGRTDAYAW